MRSRGVDSRYSWVVTVACGVVFSLTSFPMRLGAQLFVSLVDNYGATRDAASMPFELAYFARSMSGPLAGYFGQKIGLRKVTMIGCFLAAAGLFGCFFANSVTVIDISLGLIFGFGMGWASALAPEIINQHFLLHRTKAIGIVFGLSGLSASLCPPLLETLLKTYGETASFLIISGTMLNAIPAAMLLTQPDEEEIPTSKPKQKYYVNETFVKIEQVDTGLVNKSNGALDKSKEQKFYVENEFYINQNFDSERILPNDSIDPIIYNPSFTPIINSTDNLTFSRQKNEFDGTKNQQHSADKMLELDVKDLNHQLNTSVVKNSHLKTDNEIKFVSKLEVKTSMFESMNILWTPKFLLITFVQSSHFYIMYIFWTITVDVVRDKGIEIELEVYFVMALSGFDTIGRFFLASVTDCTRITAAGFSSICFIIIGLSCLLIVWVSGFKATMTAICLLGLFIGGNSTSLPGIITGFIEEEKRPMAMASRLIMYAPMSFTMSPLIGYFREVLSSYDGLLYIMMAMCFACSVVLQILLRLNTCNKR